MSQLIQLIYCSVANQPFSRAELSGLLSQARYHNSQHGITGILLHSNGSFFQVLEGDDEAIERLFERISQDTRHRQITVIIREPVSKRSFGDWTMGFAELSAGETQAILGANDFFSAGESLTRLGAGRAKKLLAAFKQGRWREKILGAEDAPAAGQPAGAALAPPGAPARRPQPNWYSFAFQPIIHAPSEAIFSYEALVRGKNQEPAGEILKQVHPDEMHRFDEQSRVQAIELAAHLGLQAHLNLNFLPLSAATSATAISSILETAGRCRIHPDQIILELLEREIIHDLTGFTAIVNAYRGSGLVFAIDDFGSGYSGLNLLAEFQPALIKLDMHLVRGIECKGPRQAIVRGIHRTCQDLGIDLIAEGVETAPEYRWLLHEGIEYFQGHLFAGPAFEQLPTSFDLPAG